VSPIGFQIFPPKDVPEDELTWTFIWGGDPNPPGVIPSRDRQKYLEIMSQGVIMQDQATPTGSHFVLSFGPFDLNVGDTLKFRVGEVLGEGPEGVETNAERLAQFVKQDFQVPFPPPMPVLKAEPGNHQVRLTWDPTGLPADKNPELYYDPYRADSAAQPFEGYRLYKSTQSISGPWTLLAEYDIPGNEFGQNIGLEYEYVDDGLLNNVEYYYTLTAFSKPDTVIKIPSQESSLNGNAMVVIPSTAIQRTVGKVAVVPNPYRGDIDYSSYNPAWEKPPPGRPWLEQDRRLQFINLPAQCVIKIYTSAGDLVETIVHDDPEKGFEDWDMTSYVRQAIASGIYLFTVEDTRTGEVQVGKFVVIK